MCRTGAERILTVIVRPYQGDWMSRILVHVSIAIAALTLLVPRGAGAQRRGAPGTVVPMTDVSITLGDKVVTGRVDAKCGIDEKATASNARAYYVLMYPWFGQRVGPDKPQWRFDLSVRGNASTTKSDEFVFSFMDGQRSGTIQTTAGVERMGSGNVRLTRHGKGARFDMDGRTKDGQPVHATIDCSEFQRAEAPGG